jgi:hypothetical protein
VVLIRTQIEQLIQNTIRHANAPAAQFLAEVEGFVTSTLTGIPTGIGLATPALWKIYREVY